MKPYQFISLFLAICIFGGDQVRIAPEEDPIGYAMNLVGCFYVIAVLLYEAYLAGWNRD